MSDPVRELRKLLRGIPDHTTLLFQNDVCYPRFELHFSEAPKNAQTVNVWCGDEIE